MLVRETTDLLKLFKLDFSQKVYILHFFIAYHLTICTVLESENKAPYTILPAREYLHGGNG